MPGNASAGQPRETATAMAVEGPPMAADDATAIIGSVPFSKRPTKKRKIP